MTNKFNYLCIFLELVFTGGYLTILCTYLTVDVSQAGEGQLEIMVNGGSVPNSVRMISKGLFAVSFVPRELRPHLVDIRFNGEPIPRKPLLF